MINRSQSQYEGITDDCEDGEVLTVPTKDAHCTDRSRHAATAEPSVSLLLFSVVARAERWQGS